MKRSYFALALVLSVTLPAATVRAQAPLPTTEPPTYSQAELDRIVSPIALYPDPLLAQVLAAVTYPADIPDAARWADDHHYLASDRLTSAIVDDQLPWDPSVQALLPFPSVLNMMARDMAWTQELGDAVLADRTDVMDAVQRLRHEAWRYGYLRSNDQVLVNNGPYIEVLPIDADYMPVPSYDPLIVFAAPRPGFVVRTAVRFHPGVRLGVGFAPWGWGTTRLVWPSHTVIINRTPWARTWANREIYVHPYAVRRYATERPLERHDVMIRQEHQREARHSSDRHHGSRY